MGFFSTQRSYTLATENRSSSETVSEWTWWWGRREAYSPVESSHLFCGATADGDPPDNMILCTTHCSCHKSLTTCKYYNVCSCDVLPMLAFYSCTVTISQTCLSPLCISLRRASQDIRLGSSPRRTNIWQDLFPFV